MNALASLTHCPWIATLKIATNTAPATDFDPHQIKPDLAGERWLISVTMCATAPTGA